MHIGYLKIKREKRSNCNICGNMASLTWDHVPPQGGIEVTQIEQETILQHLVSDGDNKKYHISQNGVKFRTICSKCNNDLLGRKYDPILNEFAIGVGRYLNTTLVLPSIIHYETKPTGLIRAIMGHLLAAKAEIDDVLFDKKMREIVLDENAFIPEDIKVFYWIYPYRDIVLIRDIVMPAVRGKFNKNGFFNILKYFPIAYILTDLYHYEGLDELTIYRHLRPDETTRIKIDLT